MGHPDELNGKTPKVHDQKEGHENLAFKDDLTERDNNNVIDVPGSDSLTDEEDDPWKVTEINIDTVPWRELSEFGKIRRVAVYVIQITLIVGLLYLFICSLDFLSSAFKLLGGKKAGQIFQNSDILTNPVAGLMMGILVTVLVQSSSTSTSIVISMVGGGILDIKTAIPIVMGANIGTSVTNTIVALGQITNKSDFRRAFAGATVHDMFNWLSVIVLLPLEVITGYLFHLSEAIINSLNLESIKYKNQDLLKVITKPFTKLIIQVNKDVIKKIAKREADEESLMKTCCDKTSPRSCCESALDHDHPKYTNFTKLERVNLCLDLPSCVGKKSCLDTMWKSTDKGKTYKLLCSENAASVVESGCCQTVSNSSLWLPDRNNYTDLERSEFCLDYDLCLRKEHCLSSWRNVSTNGGTADRFHCRELGKSLSVQSCCWEKLANLMWYPPDGRAEENKKVEFCSAVTDCKPPNVVSSACMSHPWGYTPHNGTDIDSFSCSKWVQNETSCLKQCNYLFKDLAGKISDEAIGAILLVLSLIILCVCLVCIVKLLHALLKGQIAIVIRKFVNANFPGKLSYVTGYLAILLGAGLTILVQSSSIFTSTLTPLVGIGVIEIERMYPLTLGSNIGTTMTGILAALAQSGKTLPASLQVAFCHLFFNISGILIFYPLPFFRPPIAMAKFLGNQTAKYRWFAIVYIILMFFLFPFAVFGLSVPGWYVLAGVLIPIGLIVIIITIIKFIQKKRPHWLPGTLQNWKFLPKVFRSLEPLDYVMQKILCRCCARFKKEDVDEKPVRVATANGMVEDTKM